MFADMAAGLGGWRTAGDGEGARMGLRGGAGRSEGGFLGACGADHAGAPVASFNRRAVRGTDANGVIELNAVCCGS
jgi:hypothetical protein